MSEDLARWQCFKVVSAGEIVGLVNGFRLGKVAVVELLVAAADGSSVRECPDDSFFARGTPLLGDYFVRYEDGYLSFSPKAAFEAGYTRL